MSPFSNHDPAAFPRITNDPAEGPPLVMVVEDQDMVRAAIARFLRIHGYKVLEADDGSVAMQLIASQKIDIAIVDLGLPNVSGFDLVAEIKQRRGSAVSVLVVSGTIDNEAKVRAFDAGADDYVSKPIHMPELVRRVTAFRRTQIAHALTHRARERLEQLNLYASEAAALLAHDLANGLSVALGNLDFLQETAEPNDDEDRVEARAATIRALRKMAGLVRNFVELRQLEDAALIPKRSKTEICELVRDVAGLHRHEVAPRGARIDVDCPDNLFASVDPTLFERVVHNLVGNATRYVNDNGRILVKVAIDGDPSEATIVVSIGNSGSAIPESAREHLFEKYRTAGDRKSNRGMGLYFCRLACEAHGGSIAVAPTDDFPANFVVRMPAHVTIAESDVAVEESHRQRPMVVRETRRAVGAVAVLLAVLAGATPARAQTPRRGTPSCEAVIRDRAMRDVFAISQALNQRTELVENEYVDLRGALGDWDALAGGREVTACAAKTPGFDRWWKGWVRRFADQPVNDARARLAELCAPQVRSYLRRRRERTEAALERSDLAGARALASETEIQLRSRDIFRSCPGTRDEVTHELDVAIPAIYDQVALPTVVRQLAEAYTAAREPWEAAIADLHGPADSIAPATALLASDAGQAALDHDLSECARRAAVARQLGAADASPVPAAGAPRMADVEGWCRATADARHDLLPRIAARKRTHDRIERERWERYHIDGWGMRKVYDALGRPDRVERRGSRTEWRYRGAHCATYVFGARGHQLAHHRGSCPGPATAAR